MTRMAIAILTLALLALPAHAEAQPARSTDEIAALINSAEPGSVVSPPAGTYHGSLRVAKAIVLDGRGQVTIDAGGDGSVLEVTTAGATVRGITARGSGIRVETEPAGIRVLAPDVTIEDCVVEDVLFGIDLKGARDCTVQRNTISGKDLEPGRRGDGIRLWWSHSCVIQDNHVSAARDMVFWYSEDLTIRRNHVTNSRYGLHFMYSHNTVLTENVLEGNSVGIYLMYSNNITISANTLINNRGSSGYGIGLKDCDDIVVEGNALLANRVGAYIDNSPSSVDSTGLFAGNLVAFNEVGMLLTPITHDNVFTENGFVENEEQVAVHGRGDLTLNTFVKDGRGNFWSDYAGFDQDKDGVGDLEYRAASLFETLLAREPNLRLLVHSPAQQAIEFTARALPEMRPDPKFVDPSPLMSPPSVQVAGLKKASPLAMGASAAALLLGAMGAITLLARPGRGARLSTSSQGSRA